MSYLYVRVGEKKGGYKGQEDKKDIHNLVFLRQLLNDKVMEDLQHSYCATLSPYYPWGIKND